MATKRKIYLAFLTLFILSIMTASATAAEKLAVAVNQSKVVTAYGVERVAVANPDIADVLVVSGSEVLIVGKAPGSTTLHIWSIRGRNSYLIEVAADDAPIAAEIKSILGLSNVSVSKIGRTIILEGTVNDQYQKSRAEKVAGAYADKVINMLEITQPVQVKIEAKIIEINKEKTENLGIKWGNSTLTPGAFAFGQSAINSYTPDGVLGDLNKYSPINGQLDLLVKNGAAKVLSQPNVITLSGDKANIMVGGQIPVPVGLDNGKITIEWKDYGIKLDIAPEVNNEQLINSKIKAEVSSLDWNNEHRIEVAGDLKIPPINMRKAEATIALSSGQTMAIGGLIANETSKYVSKVPVLGDIPILGKLFKSTTFSSGETELIILITPTIVDPAEYAPQSTSEMGSLIKENTWGGTADGGENKGSNS